MQEIKDNKIKRSLWAKVRRGIAIFFSSVLALIILILLLIQTETVQNFARKKIVTFLENKLGTQVAIEGLDISFPKMVVLKGIYIEDQTRDTLLAGRKLKVDIDLFKLLSNELQINEINLDGITVKIKRQLPDTIFNYQFIVDAFASDKVKPAGDSIPMKMAIEKIIIDDTRVVFLDVLTGNDADVYLGHFDTDIRTFDPNHLRYDVPRITLKGLRGKVSQTAPLVITAVNTKPDPTKTNQQPQYLKFTNQKTEMYDIDFSYSNEVSGINTTVKFKDLKISPDKFDLENNLISIKRIDLNELDGMVAMNSNAESDLIKLTTQNNRELAMEYLPWKFTVDVLRLNKNHFVFNDNTEPRLSSGMDFAHLDVRHLTLHADKFLFNRDTVTAKIVKGSMRESSGFVLQQINADVQYTSKGVRLNNLTLVTPGSEINRSVAVRYPSIEAIQKNPELLGLDLDISNSRIQVKDILTFVPQLVGQPGFKNPEDILLLNTRMTGSLTRLYIQELQLSGFENTRADFFGTADNITDLENYSVDVFIRDISTTREDMLSFLPPKTIPDSITLPATMSLKGLVKGGAKSAYVNVALTTSLGDATVDGTIANMADTDAASYSAAIVLQGLQVGRIIQQPETVGKVTASFTLKGNGYDPQKAAADIDGVFQSVEYNQYTYRNIRLDGAMAHQKFTAKGGMRDPNLHFAFEAKGNIGSAHPGFVITANIDSIKTAPLHLTADAIIYRGNIVANFPEFHLDSLNGQLLVTNSLLVANNQRISLDSVEVMAVHQNHQQLLRAKTAFLNATLSGEYKLTQLGDIFINAIQPYFAIYPDTLKVLPDPYNFSISAQVADHPALRAMIPDLKRMDAVTLDANFTSTDGWNASLKAPYILLATNKIVDLNIIASTPGNRLLIVTDAAEISSGDYMTITGTQLRTDIADNTIDFGLRVGNGAGRDRYRLQGLFVKETENTYALSFRPDSLMLNYDAWNIGSDNLIRIGANRLNASHFDLSHNNQHLVINSQDTTDNSPLEVQFVNFRMATLTAFVQTDTLLADGTLNGNILFNDLRTQPNFTTDLSINNLAINRDTIGDVNAKIDNVKANVFAANVTLTGRGNDVALTGNYFLKPADKSYMDLNLAIKSLQLNTLEGASMGSFREGKGYLSGNIKLGGTVSAPDIDGGLSFHQTSMVVTRLNNEFRIDDEQVIAVDNSGLRFNSFTVRDFADNRLTINGMAFTKNYLNYRFDLSVQARNFRGLNSAKKDNDLYYGQLFFDTNLKITGTDVSPVADGNLRINEDTRLTFVLPQSQPGVVEREGIVVFVDKDAPANDSLFLAAIDSLNKTSFLGMEVSANIEVDKKAILNLVIDEGNGDFIQLQGEAVLNGGIDKSGKITLTGSYELEEGAYEMSFNLLRRRFAIQKGSKITWTGEPTDGILDITAVYIANTSAIELVQDQITAAKTDLRYRQRLPFEVHLHMAGPLMQPVLAFEIILPEESSVRIDNEIAGQVEMRLNQLKAEPSELNKQVFALLLLNRFVSENPFAGTGGAINAGALARQSVSKILTEQLNNLAGNLIHGIDLSFDVVSTEDYTSGSLQNKTDLNIGLSKRLLNDRLNVSVGTNFALEGGRQTNQTGTAGNSTSPNINVEYFLTQNGAYRIRAYRRNEYEGVVEGYVVETGVGFVMSVDYNQLKEIFEMRKMNQRLARERKKLESDNLPPEKPANAPVNNKPDATIDNTRKDEEGE